MNRILTTTALAALIASGSTLWAQDSTSSESSSSESSSAEQMSEMSEEQAAEIFADVPNDPSLMFGTDFIGQTIYTMMTDASMSSESSSSSSESSSSESSGSSSESSASSSAPQRQSIGEINDVIMSEDGQVQYVILGIGGFLGLGERDVAVNLDALTFNPPMEDGGEEFITIDATQEQMENAPEFDRSALEEGGMSSSSSSESASSSESMSASESSSSVESEAESAASEVESEAESAASDAESAAEEAAAETENAAEDAAAATENAAENAEQEVEEEASGN